MRHVIVSWLPWALSALTIWMNLLAGNVHRSAWLVGIANQAFWLIWIASSGSWGLLPMNAALWVVYLRNHRKWRGPDQQPPPRACAAQEADALARDLCGVSVYGHHDEDMLVKTRSMLRRYARLLREADKEEQARG